MTRLIQARTLHLVESLLSVSHRARVTGAALGGALGLVSAATAWLVCETMRIGFDNALGLPAGWWLLGPALVLAPYLAVPSGIVAGAVVAPRAWSDWRPSPVRLALELGLVGGLVGLTIYSLAAMLFALPGKGPGALETGVVAFVLGLVFVPGSILLALPAAFAWVFASRRFRGTAGSPGGRTRQPE